MIGKKVDTVIILTVALMAIALYGYGQAPLGINYQGIARNMDGTPKSEQPISIRVSILDGGITGVVEYSEIHDVVTNQFGLFALVIGQGEKIGDIQNIEWSTGDKWLQVEMDAEGGNNFEIIGAQQIFSVPYAMYASQSGNGVQAGDGITVDDDIITNAAPDQPVTLLGAGNIMVSGSYPDYVITGTDNVDDSDSDPSNEFQTLDQQGANVTLSNNGGAISIEDADADPLNEIQNASQVVVAPQGNMSSLDVQSALTELQGDIDQDGDLDPSNEIQGLSSTVNGVERTIDIDGGTGTTINIEDPDSDPLNELQSLNQVGNNVTLSNGGGVITVDDGDSDQTNEIQNLSSVVSSTDRTINISGGLGTTFSVADLDDDPSNEIQNADQVSVTPAGNLTSTNVQAALTELQGDIDLDGDLDPTNEIQGLSSTANGVERTIDIDGGTGTTINIEDPDSDPLNELQSLNQVGNNVTLSNGGGAITVDDGDSDQTNEIQNLTNVAGGTDRTINISGGSGTTFSIADTDNDPVNEIQNAGQVSVTPAGNLTSTNVQAALTELQGEIDIDGDQDPGNELQSLSQVGNTVTLSDGGGSISVADNDNSSSNELQTLTQVGSEVTLSSGGGNFDINDAGGNVIANVADPIGSNDAVNKNYLDTKDATDYAFKSLINETSSGGAVTFDLSTYEFDEGPLILLSQIKILEAGVYLFNVKGSSTANAPIVVKINGSVDYPVGLININKYSDTILLKLDVDDIVELRANSTPGEVFSLEFFGFKI